MKYYLILLILVFTLFFFKRKKKAVMFDIDDTLIFVSGESNEPVINLLNDCRKKGLLIIIITARNSKYTEETKKQLAEYGIEYDYLYLRQSPQDNHDMFKSDVKKRFYENGITTIMSVGDKEMDITGPYSGLKIKLPDI